MRLTWTIALGLSFALTACSNKESSPSTDLGNDENQASADGSVPSGDGGLTLCTSDDECSDGRFCTGKERCVPAAPGADARGCIREVGPCELGNSCIEENTECKPCAEDNDLDDDTVPGVDCGGTDCNDRDGKTFPGNAEVCDDGHDEDCKPETIGERDLDNDGYTDVFCANGTVQGNDCNDANAAVHPGLPEVCNGVDDNCQAGVDEGLLSTFYPDLDGDEQGDREPGNDDEAGDGGTPDGGMVEGLLACANGPGLAEGLRDCDPSDPTRHELQVEFCDDKDNDCDGVVDENPSFVNWYEDNDGDGFGNAKRPSKFSCFPPEGSWSILKRDCDDEDADVNPTAPEVCDGKDNNCNGRADFFMGEGGYEDDDGDGKPDARCAIENPDCDDLDYTTFGGAPELCDGRDNDCDGKTDVGAKPVQWYVDVDHDGYGAKLGATESCVLIEDRVLRGGDCADQDPTQHPGRLDDCSGEPGVDDDCDGTDDEGELPYAWYADPDGDGFGGGEPVVQCAELAAHVLNAGDCAVEDELVFPGATESCDDEVDNDCDGETDCDDTTCYAQAHCKVEAEIVLVSGDKQAAPVGKVLANPIRVRLRKPDGSVLAGAQVTLSATGSGASVSGSTTPTDASGIATFVVRAGRRVGQDHLRLSAAAARSLDVTLTVTEPPAKTVLTLVNAANLAGTTPFPAGGKAIATWARPPDLWGVTAAKSGTLYLSSHGDARIYSLDINGQLEHIAGDMRFGYADNEPALTSAMWPRGLVLDESDPSDAQLYLVDRLSSRIRVISLRTGLINTVAGGGVAEAPGFGDGQAATSASLLRPAQLTQSGRTLYFTDEQMPNVRKVDLDSGIIDSVNLPSTAELSLCSCAFGCGIAASPQGELFIAARAVGSDVQDPDGTCSDTRATAIVRVDASGAVHHVAGRRLGGASDGLSALATRLPNPIAMTFDAAGNLYYAGDARVRRIDGTTSVVETVFGDGTAGITGDYGDGPARFRTATALAFVENHLLVADQTAASLRSVWGLGRTIPSTISATLESDSETASHVLSPAAKVVVRITSSLGTPLAQVPVHTRNVSAGARVDVTRAFSGADGRASITPWPGRALKPYAFTFVTKTIHGSESTAPLTVSVTGTAPPVGTVLPLINVNRESPYMHPDGRVLNGVPGPAITARIGQPHALAMASDGTLYVSSTTLHAVYRVTPDGQISLLAGSGSGVSGSSGDGLNARSALLDTPIALALDEARGLLYVGESGSNSIRSITLGANPIIDFVAPVNRIMGLAADASGDLYVAKETVNAGEGFDRIDAETHLLETIIPGGLSGPGETHFVSCSQNCAVAVDELGRLYVSGQFNGPTFTTAPVFSGAAVVSWQPSLSPPITHLAGASWSDGGVDKTDAKQVNLVNVRGIAARGPELFFSEPEMGRVRRYSEGEVVTVMGQGTATGDFVPREQLKLSQPEGVVVTPDRHLIVAEKGASKVRMVWSEAAFLPPAP